MLLTKTSCFGLVFLWSIFVLAACTNINPVLPDRRSHADFPTLEDFWQGRAEFVVDVNDTGLPLGESDTVVMPDGVLLSYLHASDQSAGVQDQCGSAVPFPGCAVVMGSLDRGRTFGQVAGGDRQCLIPCTQCPCDSKRDHIDQQQYPRVAYLDEDNGAGRWWMVYEYRANTFLRRSVDGFNWGDSEEIPLTGIWNRWLMPCRQEESIGEHPFSEHRFDCLVGAPPGIFLDQEQPNRPELYVFVGLGQNPGSMGCYRGDADGPTVGLRKCRNNPLFTGAQTYGPLDRSGNDANTYFDFRTVSSADVLKVGQHYYMFYEGVRGPGPGDSGDTQFALGLARSRSSEIDGPWELHPHNPVLVDLPGNVGLGHADIVVIEDETVLFTSLDGEKRSRLVLVWLDQE